MTRGTTQEEGKTMLTSRTTALAVAVLLGCSGAAFAAATIINLGTLPGGTSSSAWGHLSAAGSTVAGFSDPPTGYRAFRWRSTEGMVDLGVLSGGGYSIAFGASGDGSVVAGQSGS